MSGTPIPDHLNSISCSRINGKLFSLAQQSTWRAKMTWEQLQEFMDGLTPDQLKAEVIILSPDHGYCRPTACCVVMVDHDTSKNDDGSDIAFPSNQPILIG